MLVEGDKILRCCGLGLYRTSISFVFSRLEADECVMHQSIGPRGCAAYSAQQLANVCWSTLVFIEPESLAISYLQFQKKSTASENVITLDPLPESPNVRRLLPG